MIVSKQYRVEWFTRGRKNTIIITDYARVMELVIQLLNDQSTIEFNVSIHEA